MKPLPNNPIYKTFSYGLLCLCLMSCGSESESSDTTPPGDVQNMTISPGDQQILLAWEAPMDEDLEAYLLTYTPNGPQTPIQYDTQTTSVTIEDLVNGTKYAFTAKTEDTAGNQSHGITLEATPEKSNPHENAFFLEDFEEACIPGNAQNPDINFESSGWVRYSILEEQRMSDGISSSFWVCVPTRDGISVIGSNTYDNLLVRIAPQLGDETLGISDAPADDWLISPSITLTGTIPYSLYFDYSYFYPGLEEGFGLKVFVSENYSGSGDPSAATWVELELGLEHVEEPPLNPELGTHRADTSLASYTGKSIHLAFYFKSRLPEEGIVIEAYLDNILITTE